MSESWTVREIRTLHKVIVEHDGLIPTICTLTYMDFDREIVLEHAYLIAAAPALRDALRGLANNAPGAADRDPCWCSESWAMRGGYSHSPECLDARAALAASAPPPTAAAGSEDGA